MDILSNSTFEPMCLSRNPIEINVDAFDPQAATRAGIRYYLDIFLPAYYRASNFEKKATLEASEQPPYMIGTSTIFAGATFSIEELIDSYLSVKPPTFGQSKISVCPSATINFYTSHKAQQATTVQTGTNQMLWAIKGGIQEEYFEEWKDTFFTDYIGARRSFLTFQNTEKKVRQDAPEYLYWLSNISPTPSKIKLRIEVQYEDNTSEIMTGSELSGILTFAVYCIPVGATVLLLGNLPKVVVSYRVWLSDEANQRLTEARKYVLDYSYERNIRYILYQNSLGGFDTLCLTGQASESIKVERQIFEREQPFYYSATFAERTINKTTGIRELVINTGWIEKNTLFQYHDLMLTRQIILVSDREYVPLVVKNDSLLKHKDDDNLTARELTFEYSNRETNVTPLPIAAAKVERPTSWRPYQFGGCVLDANGRRAGFQQINLIEKYYKDDGASVKPYEIKANTPDTEGYIPPVPTSACSVATTPYLSTAISRIGSFHRNNCSVGQFGSKALVVVPAGAYGSELSQADANAKAEAAWGRLNTQAYANDPANGATCSVSPETYLVPGVPAGSFNYRWYDKAGSDAGGQLYGGLGTYSGSYTDIAFGVGWALQANTNAGTIKYPQGANDCVFPCNVGTYAYQMVIAGNTVQRTVRLYYNGVLQLTRVITPGEFQANNYYIRVLLPTPIPSGAMVYLSVE